MKIHIKTIVIAIFLPLSSPGQSTDSLLNQQIVVGTKTYRELRNLTKELVSLQEEIKELKATTRSGQFSKFEIDSLSQKISYLENRVEDLNREIRFNEKSDTSNWDLIQIILVIILAICLLGTIFFFLQRKGQRTRFNANPIRDYETVKDVLIQSSKNYEVHTRVRHLRNLFLVSTNFPNESLIKIFITNLNHWGGRYNPIIPIEEANIAESWKELIKHSDPDFVYYSPDLDLEFVKDLCLELKFNPIEILELEDRSTRIEGVDIHSLLPLIDDQSTLIEATNLNNVKSPLKDFFELNFLISNLTHYESIKTKAFKKIEINDSNFDEFCKIVHKNKPFNKSTLSTVNIQTKILRSEDPPVHDFELIIAKDLESLEDLVYFWNRQLFFSPQYTSHYRHLIITLQQLELLKEDEFGKGILMDCPTNNGRIDLISFSLTPEELEAEREKLQKWTKYNHFTIVQTPSFPFEIRSHNNPPIIRSRDRTHSQIIHTPKQLIKVPSPSFGSDLEFFSQKYALDVSISTIGQTRADFRFPYSTNPAYLFRSKGRINRIRECSLIINSQSNEKNSIELTIPNPKFLAEQIITEPLLLNERKTTGFSRTAYNDDSRKLNEFISLFKSNLGHLEEIMFDKFLSDIFFELSTNTKNEGDCISFQELLEKCENAFVKAGGTLGNKGQTFQNLENLSLGLKTIIQDLANDGVFFPGFKVKCQNCSSNIWYSVNESLGEIKCKGCFNTNRFIVENPISYKLNSLIKNNISRRNRIGQFIPQGNNTVIKTLIHLRNKARTSFIYQPQLDLFTSNHSPKPQTDLDIFCIVDGLLYVGECKHSSPLFFENQNKSLDNLVEIAQKILPDFIVISCTEDKNDKLKKARQYLTHKMYKWKHKPEILNYLARTPDYFNFNGGRYFYY